MDGVDVITANLHKRYNKQINILKFNYTIALMFGLLLPKTELWTYLGK